MSTRKLSTPFTLYEADYSICAITVRITHAMRGEPRPDYPDMNWLTKTISISPENPEQLSEFYLCKVNTLGQVPVLVNDALLPSPIPDSVSITWYLCEWYPDLLPPQHAKKIKELIHELHQINIGALTTGGSSKYPTELLAKARELLQQNDISNTYKSVLENKINVLLRTQAMLAPENIPEHLVQTRQICAKVATLKEQHNAKYVFGPQPTALDAHMLVFLRRIKDSGFDEHVPQTLREWSEELSKEEIWMTVVPGRKTLPPYVR